jgi:AcrR family transcriptional regulator
MSKTRTKKSDARQRIVETAERLFYAEGIRAVGIDRIIAEAQVAKMTLYNHFASKDDLILAVLQYREKEVNEMFAKSIERHVRKGKDRLVAFFAVLKEWFESSGFRGCSFINAAVELADVGHPASQFSAAHKELFHGMLLEILVEVAGEKASAVAPAISLLVEGAIVTALMEQSSKPANVARDAALALVSKNSRKRK